MPQNTKPNSIAQYLNWIITQYHELQKQAQNINAYRIVSIEHDHDSKCKLTIQITGKNVTFKAHPEELAGDDKMLENFSKQDVRTITYFACEEISKPKYNIVVQEFCDKLNKILYHVQKRGSNKIEKKTAEEISLDKEMIKKMDPKDSHMVGYNAAMSTSTIQHRIIKEPKYKIVLQEFCDKLNKIIFHIKHKTTNKIEKKTACEISLNNNMIKHMRANEAHIIGFASGSDGALNHIKSKAK